jgi:hypothetical protein
MWGHFLGLYTYILQSFGQLSLPNVRNKPPEDHQSHSEDTGMENVSKAKFTSAGGCAGTRAGKHRAVRRSAFMVQWGPAPFTPIGPVRVHSLLVIG